MFVVKTPFLQVEHRHVQWKPIFFGRTILSWALKTTNHEEFWSRLLDSLPPEVAEIMITHFWGWIPRINMSASNGQQKTRVQLEAPPEFSWNPGIQYTKKNNESKF